MSTKKTLSKYAWHVPSKPDSAATHELTFDEELLLWLGDESAEVRAADGERVRDIASEFARGFDALARVGPAVTVLGSARTPRDHPDYALVRETGACLGRAGYAVITGGGPGLMKTANRGASTAVGKGDARRQPRRCEPHPRVGAPCDAVSGLRLTVRRLR